MLHRSLLLIICCLLAWSSLSAQGWIRTYYDEFPEGVEFSYCKPTQDNGYILAGRTGLPLFPNLLIIKTDQFGDTIWTYEHPLPGTQRSIDIEYVEADSSYAILFTGRAGAFDANLLRLDAFGNVISDLDLNTNLRVTMGSPNANLAVTSDDYLLITALRKDSLNNSNISLAKLDTAGNFLWDRSYHVPYFKSNSMDIKETADNNYIMAGTIDTNYAGSNGNGADILLIKTDTAGDVIWWQEHAIGTGWTQNCKSIINTSDGGYIVTGRTDLGFGFDQSIFALKVDALGDEEWHWISNDGDYNYGYGIYEDTDGSFVMTGYLNSNNSSTDEVAIIRLSATGSLISLVTTGTNVTRATGVSIYPNRQNNGYIIFGGDDQGAFLMTVDSMGVAYSNQLTGQYYFDRNSNCVRDTNEYPYYFGLVEADNGVTKRYGSVGFDGKYSIDLDSGTYTITPLLPSPYWQIGCQTSYNITFNGFYNQDSADFALQFYDSCAFLQVDISSPRLRRCFPSYYAVSYQNLGTAPAYNAYVDVTLDPYITYDSCTAPLISQNGNTYRFQLDTVDHFWKRYFFVFVTVDCDSTVLGQVHCTEAHIYPDTLCSNTWNGPIIQATSTCANDSVHFRLQNVGAAMQTSRNYSIIEEHVMIRSSPFQLGSGSDQWISIPAAPGASYRLEAEQASGFPLILGDSIAISNQLGCNSSSPFNFPGILAQFFNGNSSPFIAVDCQPNIGSYDPNDKQAQPVGYGAQHYIHKNIPLNYHIRFQNTGTDTAFRVVVVDTLDPNLDPSSIQMGASSHPYTWQLRESNILVVTFDPIELPDSNVNELASNGFFKFEIKQQLNNPIGTVIRNKAAIYFDFNAPIITNETFHTIGENFVVVMLTPVEQPELEGATVNVYPNPFEQYTTLEVEGLPLGDLELEIFNSAGQLVQRLTQAQSQQIQLHRGDLASGLYFFRLNHNQQHLQDGKLIIR